MAAFNPGALEQASFLHPRDPSITGWDQRLRFVAPVRKQLFNEVLEEETVKPERSVINTYLRLKPNSVPNEQATLNILNETTVVTNAPKESVAFKNKISGRVVHQYSFSKVYPADTTQKDLFDDCVAYQVKDFILGSNCLLFAYGTTNAGKTFTIQGNPTSPGLIPRAVDSLFKAIQGQVAGVGKYKPDKVEGIFQLDSATISQELDYKNRILQWNWDKPFEPIKGGSNESPDITASSESDFISNTYREMQKTLSNDSPFEMANDSDVVYGVWISFAEVYNESIFDLLEPMLTKNRKRTPLKMAQDGEGNTFIRDLRMIHVSSGEEAFHIMHYGKANLQVAATNMNMRSSRSHCIFTIKLVRYANSDNPSYAIVSSFTFCDLAGAERAKKTLNAGERLRESNNINTSLHVLGRCLATIRENQVKNERKPVPFRDSKLTRIFQRALTGHERITMVVAANTAPVLFDETLNVLKFSAIAKQIVLETPIKKVKPKKKSRFSVLATQPLANICWNAPPPEADSSCSTVASNDDCVQKYNAQNEELILLVDKLKAQVAAERDRNLNLERDVRQSVTETFSKIIADMEKSHKIRLQDVEERNENLSTWRIAQVENFYKQKLENSRKRSRRDSDEDESIVVCDSPEKDGRIQELEKENELLEEKCSAVHKLLREAQEIQTSLASDVSSLRFELADSKSELEKCQSQLLALDQQREGSDNAFSDELKLQLAAEKKKNENLCELLNEAKSDVILLIKEKEEAEKELEKFQSELLEKGDEISELTSQLEIAQQMHADSVESFNKVETEFEAVSKAHETCERDMNEISSLLKEQEEAVEELQAQLESLTVSDQSSATASDSNKPRSLLSLTRTVLDALKLKLDNFENLKSEVSELKCLLRAKEDEAEKTQQNSSETENLKERVDSLERALKEKRDIIECLNNEKASMESEIKELKNGSKDVDSDKEVKHLQKEFKNLLQEKIEIIKQLEDAKLELESTQNTSTRLEKELKSALQKSSSQLNSSVSSQFELEMIKAKTQNDEQMKFVYDTWREQNETLKSQLKAAQEEIQTREKLLLEKEQEIESIQDHRQKLIGRYEDAYNKVQDELEREKREVVRIRETLYKSTPTPNKNSAAEIKRLKGLVEDLQEEISTLKMSDDQPSGKKPSRSASKSKHASISSNESLKENKGDQFPVPLSASKPRRATAVDYEDVTSSNSKTKPVEVLEEQQSEVKPKRKTRRLFSRTQSQQSECDVDESLEVNCTRGTTPNSFVRSLRNRQV